jgi:hypothetical protein
VPSRRIIDHGTHADRTYLGPEQQGLEALGDHGLEGRATGILSGQTTIADPFLTEIEIAHGGGASLPVALLLANHLL